MVRKAAMLERTGGRGPRQRTWEAVRASKVTFSAQKIAAAIGVEKATAAKYLLRLERGGYIEAAPADRDTAQKHYRLVRDGGVEAPRLDANGAVITRTLGLENMWNTMHIMGTFTARELAMRSCTDTAQVTYATAKAYAFHLKRAGYLKALPQPRVGHNWKEAKYQLIPGKRTGPRPPIISVRKTLYDPNIDCVVWQEEPDRDAC
ncbi:hypothetical protein [Paraburkholderia sp.]|uniref:hypothetical protein n=1 Tax=Paraburkholderia sp. TaxID=1926495 RepID=UPI002D38D770|nr:hypothetical protein [Paraburkholderia sp.]HZZ04609.1 hypothetical protein [Paraburkholderia sp.]